MHTIPLSAYIHLPWCVRKCPYCDFNSHTAKDNMDEKLYLKALLADIEFEAQSKDERIIETIFIGGGTPSLFSAHSIYLILEKLRNSYGFSDNVEITIEANPGTIEHDSFAAYKDAGVSRVSLGVQSFNPQQLQILGRIHDHHQANAAIEQVMSCGFNSVNIDIMHGLAKQTTQQAIEDLTIAIHHQPQHISWYQLTIEKNTLFDCHPPELPSEDCIAEIQSHGKTLLDQHQYTQYEVSAFSKPNQQCRHNLNYWRFGDYLGFGAGAHSKITINYTKIERMSRCKHPQQYMNQAGTSESIQSILIKNDAELIFEFLMNHLRISIPVTKLLFANRTGIDWQQLITASNKAIKLELIKIDDSTLELTPLGQQFLNDTLMTYLPSKKT